MKSNVGFQLFLLFLTGMYMSCSRQSDATDSPANNEEHDSNATEWVETKISTAELLTWQLLGEGKVSEVMGEQISLQESDQSKGVMLLSPAYYEGDIIVRYNALALTPPTVFVTVLSAKDNAAEQLTVPADYDGTMGFWTTETSNYFFAFKNATHGSTPFILKNPAAEKMVNAPEQDRMTAGVYYDIEVGREGDRLWLSIDGEEVVDMVDESPVAGGHVAFRLRGTAGLPAIGFIKALSIYTKP